MAWFGKGAIGVVLMVVGTIGFLLAIWELAKTGTCGSGTYVSTRACPSSTPLYIGGIFAGVIAFLGGGALFATRGREATDPGLPPPKDEPLSANPPPLSGYYPPK
jgi:hypothetical protein